MQARGFGLEPALAALPAEQEQLAAEVSHFGSVARNARRLGMLKNPSVGFGAVGEQARVDGTVAAEADAVVIADLAHPVRDIVQLDTQGGDPAAFDDLRLVVRAGRVVT